MSTREVPAATETRAFPEEKFLAWLDESSTPAFVSVHRKQYYAYCFEFGIAGCGSTREEAIQDATVLLVKYLIVCFSEGRRYEDAKKSPPMRIRLKSRFLAMRAKLSRIGPSLSRLDWPISVPTTSLDVQHLAH
jgi:hypothetical protein